jgi:hypothetical protein
VRTPLIAAKQHIGKSLSRINCRKAKEVESSMRLMQGITASRNLDSEIFLQEIKIAVIADPFAQSAVGTLLAGAYASRRVDAVPLRRRMRNKKPASALGLMRVSGPA